MSQRLSEEEMEMIRKLEKKSNLGTGEARYAISRLLKHIESITPSEPQDDSPIAQ